MSLHSLRCIAASVSLALLPAFAGAATLVVGQVAPYSGPLAPTGSPWHEAGEGPLPQPPPPAAATCSRCWPEER